MTGPEIESNAVETKDTEPDKNTKAPEELTKKEAKAAKKEAKDAKKEGKKAKKEKAPVKPEKTELEKLQDKVKNLEKEVASEKEKYMFLQAELENTRKHFIRQGDLAKKRATVQTITSFAPLIDSFEMANTSITQLRENCEPEKLETFLKGFENLNQSLLSIFDSFGVKPIDTIDKPFDYKFHEVVLKMEKDNCPEDTIIQVVQKGYLMNGDVIRPAKVIVSKCPPPPEPEKKEEPEKIVVPEEEKAEDKAEEKKIEAENPSPVEEVK